MAVKKESLLPLPAHTEVSPFCNERLLAVTAVLYIYFETDPYAFALLR